jgi:hypothetical protein
MADKRISELTELGDIASNDFIPLVDTSVNETKKVSAETLSNFVQNNIVIPPSTTNKIEQGDSSVEAIDTGSYGKVVINTEGTDRVTVDSSGNVGIGTSSPLSAAGYTALTVQNNTNGGIVEVKNSAVQLRMQLDSTATGNFGTYTNHPLVLLSNGAERARFDTNGNINIATAGARITGDFSNATIANRVMFQTSTANSNSIVGVMPSGTAQQSNFNTFNNSDPTNASNMGIYSNAIEGAVNSGRTGTGTFLPMTFYTGGSERMRILTSTTPSAVLGSTNVLEGYGRSTFSVVHASGGLVEVGTSGGGRGIMYWDEAGNSLILSGRSTNSSVALQSVGTGAVTVTTNSLERMRIDSSGNVGIGTSSPAWRLTVSDGTVNGGMVPFGGELITGTISNHPLAIYTNNTERMRITAGGEVLVGGNTDNGAYNLQCNGTGVWGAGAYVNGSDARIKDDIAPIASGLDVVTKLNPVTYRYKEDWSKDQSTQTGFIAQELLTALEGQVYVDGVVQQGGTEGYYSVAYQNIIPILTKAIQELKAELDSVKAELTILKGN